MKKSTKKQLKKIMKISFIILVALFITSLIMIIPFHWFWIVSSILGGLILIAILISLISTGFEFLRRWVNK